MTTLIGTNPDQIPVNSMLGGMAYQDPDSINVKDFNSSGTANIASLVSPTASVTTLTNTTANITTANITNVSYTGTLTGGTGVINIGSNQIYKDASGNVGIGTVTNSWGVNFKGLQVGAVGSVSYDNNFGQVYLGTNFYMSGAGAGTPTYITSNPAARVEVTQSGLNYKHATTGTAGTSITWNTLFQIDASGNQFNLGTGATKLQEGTTAQRPASPQEGMIRKNSTTNYPEVYSNAQWRSFVLNTDTKVVRVTPSNVSLSGQTSVLIDVDNFSSETGYIVKLLGVSSNGAQIPQLLLTEVSPISRSSQGLVTKITNAGVVTSYAWSDGSVARVYLNTSSTSATASLYGTIQIQEMGAYGFFSGVLYSIDGATTATINVSGTYLVAAGIDQIGIDANGGTFDAGDAGLTYMYST